MTTRARRSINIAIIFLIGFALGMHAPPWLHYFAMRYRKETSADRAEKQIRTFSRQFGLDEEQTEKARIIITGQRQKMAALRQEVHPRLRAIIEEARSEMRKILHPKQIEHFDAVNQASDERQKVMDRLGPPPGNPMHMPPPPPPGAVGGP